MKPLAYYNDNDPYCAQWLRNLIEAGHIAPGHVDSRPIEMVTHDDLRGYKQCHFFAGIGGWSLGLRLAGWPDDEPVWTGSCPCQPFSQVGLGKGIDDARHLWPAWYRLISVARPPVIYGEQVAPAVGSGWFDSVAYDLESQNYAVSSAILPACSVSAPHQRPRLWYVADAISERLEGYPRHGQRSGEPGWLAEESPRPSCAARVRSGEIYIWPHEPALPRVVDGVSNRVAKVRAIGNALVPQLAAEFIGATL